MSARTRYIAGRIVDIPDGECAYCYAAPPRPRQAPAFHCAKCDRHMAAGRLHYVIYHHEDRVDVHCGRCASQAIFFDEYRIATTRASTAVLLGVWPEGSVPG